jgi:hypothetical protein
MVATRTVPREIKLRGLPQRPPEAISGLFYRGKDFR